MRPQLLFSKKNSTDVLNICIVRFITIFAKSIIKNAMRKTVKEMIDLIEADGWFIVRQRGSHKQYAHPTKKGTVTVPDHGKTTILEHFVVNSILNQAGLK